jgi:hypothetical protein
VIVDRLPFQPGRAREVKAIKLIVNFSIPSALLANDADANYLEPNGVVFEDLSQLRLTASFSRRISALSADYIHEHLERTPAVTVTHDGIWDGADRQRGSV